MTSEMGLVAGVTLEALVAAHEKAVYRLALRRLGDPEEASSATQDCFLRAFGAIRRCPSEAAGQRRWLSRMVINQCLDRQRSRKWTWWQRRLGLEGGAAARDLGISPERELLGKEMARRLARALAGLSPRQRSVFVLRHCEGHSLAQIARRLALDVGTVKTHLSRAVRNLRRELEDLRRAATVLLLLAALAALALGLKPRPMPRFLSAADERLLREVEILVNRTAPRALAPATLLVPEEIRQP